MIPRYSRPEMARIWSDENRFATWLKVEIAATEALAGAGIVPREALSAITSRARFDAARIDAIEKEVQHDVIAGDVSALMDAVRQRAFQHKDTPMIGRTHGVHAEPMTFGLKLALWHAEVQRDVERVKRARAVVSVGKLSGAVGTFGHLP